MNEAVKFLTDNSVFHISTIGKDGKPKCRPFGLVIEHDGKIWFCTANTKLIYAELQANPYLEISATSPAFAWMRLSGKAVFENNMAVKELCLNDQLVKQIYTTADNPLFEVFYLADAKAVIADFSGNPPREYNL